MYIWWRYALCATLELLNVVKERISSREMVDAQDVEVVFLEIQEQFAVHHLFAERRGLVAGEGVSVEVEAGHVMVDIVHCPVFHHGLWIGERHDN